MGVRLITRGGKRYVYWCTSKSVPGRSTPVSVKKYIGVLDDDGRTVVPKRFDLDSWEAPVIEGCFNVLEYGSVLLAVSALKSQGLLEPMRAAYGDAFPAVLSAAVAYAIDPSSSGDVPPPVDRLCFDGLPVTDIPSPSVVRSTLSDVQGMVSAYSDTISVQDTAFFFEIPQLGQQPQVTHRSIIDGVKEMMVAHHFIMADRDGIPLSYGVVSGCFGNIDASVVFAQITKHMACRPVLIHDTKNNINPGDIRAIVGEGIGIVSIVDATSGTYKGLVSELRGLLIDGDRTVIGKHMLMTSVMNAGFIGSKGADKIVSERDSRFRSATDVVRAMLAVDVNPDSGQMEGMTNMIRRRREHLESEQVDVDSSKMDSRLFNVSDDGSGRRSYEVKERVMKQLKDSIGVLLVITTMSDFEGCLEAIRSRDRIMNEAATVLNGTRGGWTDESTIWQAVPRLIALRIRVWISKVLESEGLGDITVGDVFRTVSKYRKIETGGGRTASSIPMDARRMLEFFDVPFD